jgi:DNA-directed RNA polymerase specialized sigma24 family protein
MATVHDSSADAPREPPFSSEATVDLLDRVKQGDAAALDRLLRRCVPLLLGWARGRIPAAVLGTRGTADLVHQAVLSAMNNLDAIDARHEGALQAHLRQAVMCGIRDFIGSRTRPAEATGRSEPLVDEQTSPLDEAIGSENIARYERALWRLVAADREAVIGRIELRYSYEELAVALGEASASAARTAVAGAMRRLAGEMLHG